MWLLFAIFFLSIVNSQKGELEGGIIETIIGAGNAFEVDQILKIVNANISEYDDEGTHFGHINNTEPETFTTNEDPMEVLTLQVISQSEMIAQLEKQIKKAEKEYEDSMKIKQECGKTVVSLQSKTNKLKYEIKSHTTYVDEMSKEHADLGNCKADNEVTFDKFKSQKENNNFLSEKTQVQRNANTDFVKNNRVYEKLVTTSFRLLENTRERVKTFQTVNTNKDILAEGVTEREMNLKKQSLALRSLVSESKELGNLQNSALEILQVSLEKHENAIELKEDLLETLQSSLGGILTLASNSSAAEKMLVTELEMKNNLLVAQNDVIENRKLLLTEQPGLSKQMDLIQKSFKNQIELLDEANKINENKSKNYKKLIDDKKAVVSVQSKTLEILTENLAPFIDAGQLFSLERDGDGNLIKAKSCQCVPNVPDNTTISIVINNTEDELELQWSKWEYTDCFSWTIRNNTMDCAKTDDGYKVRRRIKDLSSPALGFEEEIVQCFPCKEQEMKLNTWTDFGECDIANVSYSEEGNFGTTFRQRTDIKADGLLTTVEELDCKNCVLGEWEDWQDCYGYNRYSQDELPDTYRSYLEKECLVRNRTILQESIGINCTEEVEYRGFIQRLDYGRNERRSWDTKANPGNKIKFTFTKFDIETAVDASECAGCECDWLKIIDGSGEELIGQTCGTTMPPPVISKSNRATVEFKTDGYTHRSGFKIKWEEVN